MSSSSSGANQGPWPLPFYPTFPINPSRVAAFTTITKALVPLAIDNGELKLQLAATDLQVSAGGDLELVNQTASGTWYPVLTPVQNISAGQANPGIFTYLVAGHTVNFTGSVQFTPTTTGNLCQVYATMAPGYVSTLSGLAFFCQGAISGYDTANKNPLSGVVFSLVGAPNQIGITFTYPQNFQLGSTYAQQVCGSYTI